MEIETIPPEAELSTQTRKNPASQRLMPTDVSFVGWRGSLFCFVLFQYLVCTTLAVRVSNILLFVLDAVLIMFTSVAQCHLPI